MEKDLKQREQRIIRWLTHAVVFLVGMLIAILIGLYKPELIPEKVEVRGGQYGLVNPLLDCKEKVGFETKELISFRQEVENFVKEEIRKDEIRSASIYFRDLNNGPWFGIDEKEEFISASLLKIAVMMGYFKYAESHPKILEERVTIQAKAPLYTQKIKPSKVLEDGKSYTIRELIYQMMAYSDNQAMELLINFDKGASYNNTLADLGIVLPEQQKDKVIRVKDYASFFRVLYNASYLNKEMSNLALKWLAEADFKRGIVAGVPAHVVVAHKFGERELIAEDQFHDCGIVYYPKRPYLFCVMSRGDNFENLIKFVKDISSLAYNHVANQSTEDK